MRAKPSPAFAAFIEVAKKTPMLTREQEVKFAKKLKKSTNPAEIDFLVNKLVQANLRFVLSIAHKYTGTGIELEDLFQEGALGLMDATRKFDVDRGYRLISYGVWYIKAYINRLVLNNFSLVKFGTTQAQRTLFFKLRTTKAQMESEFGEVNPALLAKELKVSEAELMEAEIRMAAKDFSLNATLGAEGAGHTHLDMLEATTTAPEDAVVREVSNAEVRHDLSIALEELTEKERKILRERVMAEDPKTLAQIASEHNVSRERIRQIEKNLLGKLRQHVAEVAA